jgi:hypothetical protein
MPEMTVVLVPTEGEEEAVYGQAYTVVIELAYKVLPSTLIARP